MGLLIAEVDDEDSPGRLWVGSSGKLMKKSSSRSMECVSGFGVGWCGSTIGCLEWRILSRVTLVMTDVDLSLLLLFSRNSVVA